MRGAGLLFLLIAELPTQAVGQDLLAVAPFLAQVEYEDSRVRVVRLRIPERAAVATHDRPRRVVVSLTANDVRLVLPDGTEKLTRTEAGSFAWSEPTVRRVQNLGGPLENIVVELKGATEATIPRPAPPDPPAADDLVEARHQWRFENQYVRVYEVRIPPGKATAFHRHAYDQVTVFVSGGRISEQKEGDPWGAPREIKAGSVSFTANAANPLTHRVRNEGTTEYRVILVQLLGRGTESR